MEFAGAVLIGKQVTETVRKGIIDGASFEDNPELLMLGMVRSVSNCGGVLKS